MAKKKQAKKAPKKVPTKKVEIHKTHDWNGDMCYAYTTPKNEVWTDGYARPWTAMRGAQRHFRDFINKGGKLEFIRNY